jgi:hypothetical protein
MPNVSIIIPFFNVGGYIRACGESVLAQTYRDIEAIFVDDCSADCSRDIVEELRMQDGRVRIVTHDVNRGLGQARNTGVRAATGKFLFFIDSDDFLAASDVIERLVAAAEGIGSDCSVLIANSVVAGAECPITDHPNRAESFVTGREAFFGSLGASGFTQVPIRAWGSLIRRSYYNSVGVEFPQGEHEDMAQMPFLYLGAARVYLSSLIAVAYRERSGSLSRASWDRAKLQRYAALWRLIKKRSARFGIGDGVAAISFPFAIHLMDRVNQSSPSLAVSREAICISLLILKDGIRVVGADEFARLMKVFLFGHHAFAQDPYVVAQIVRVFGERPIRRYFMSKNLPFTSFRHPFFMLQSFMHVLTHIMDFRLFRK